MRRRGHGPMTSRGNPRCWLARWAGGDMAAWEPSRRTQIPAGRPLVWTNEGGFVPSRLPNPASQAPCRLTACTRTGEEGS